MVGEIKTIEERQNKLIELGTKQGYITYEQLANELKGLDMDSDTLDDLYNVLVQNGIDVVLAEIKKIANETNCPILLLSQLSRSVENRKEHRPLLRDFKSTDKISDYADVIILLYRDEYYNRNSKQRGVMEVIVAKDTLGYPGTVELDYRSDSC